MTEDQYRARLDAVLALHAHYGIYEPCGHHHTTSDLDAGDCIDVPEVGLVCEDGWLYAICTECCTRHDEQTEECVTQHEGPCFPCRTVNVALGVPADLARPVVDVDTGGLT